MKDGFHMDLGISATDSSSFVHRRLIQVTFMIARLMPCIATWVLSLILCALKYLFDARQSLEFPLVKTVTVPGKKTKTTPEVTNRAECQGMSFVCYPLCGLSGNHSHINRYS